MNSPKARTEKLIVRELPDETLIYDEKTGKAHCLNGTAAQVWKLCNGTTTPAEMTKELAGTLGRPEASAVVRLALEQLSHRNLIEGAIRPLSGKARLNRREVLKGLAKGAVVAAALPLIMTMASKTGRAAVESLTRLDCGRCTVNVTGSNKTVTKACGGSNANFCVCPAAKVTGNGNHVIDCVQSSD